METWQDHVASALFTASISDWLFAGVNRQVPEPYLDEFFHVPQAQKYCAGDYTWDPKITTPPGLYLVAKLLSPVFGCSTKALRVQNVFALGFILLEVLQIRRCIHHPGHAQRTKEDFVDQLSKDTPKEPSAPFIEEGQSPFSTALTAFNIASFPPLFFFGALYYTDVMSTAAVLISYHAFLYTNGKVERSFGDDILAFVTGIVALFFRQTNIFWVAVFPAGMTVVNVFRYTGRISGTAYSQGHLAVLRESWSRGAVHNPTLRDKGLTASDTVMLLLTTALAVLSSPVKVFRSIIAYVFLLVLFTGFVIWNGSVVLGDKSAHTATIHTPQMLYIWPYIALFSAPILLGPLLTCVTHMLPSTVRAKFGLKQKSSYPITPQLLQAIIFIAVGLLAVHFNTIVHPYTLADNRHYVFYVFRMLLRHTAIKYLAVPVYYACFWLSIQSLVHLTEDSQVSNSTIQARDSPGAPRNTPGTVDISFVVIWLITTALSVVTAPLVEPRYFIVPWIIWRLHVPHAPTIISINGRRFSPDLRLVIETVWLLAINQILQYLFLNKTFTWPSEPGKVQRFLW